MTEDPSPPLLERLGLHRPELRAWAMYDWANSAMVTLIVTAVFPIFYKRVAADGLTDPQADYRFSITTTIALAASALLSPLLGSIADQAAAKKRFLGLFLALGALATAMMFFVQSGMWLPALVLFALSNIGANGSFVFYDSLLPHVATPREMDRVSTAGYALGYIGGGILLVFALWMIRSPSSFGLPSGDDLSSAQASLPARISFLLTSLWWVLFSIPLFRRVREPAPVPRPPDATGRSAFRLAFQQLADTLHHLRTYKQAFLFLIAFLIYNDGIGTIIRMATLYGETMQLSETVMIGAIAAVQFVGIPCSFAFGRLAGKIGTRQAIFLGLVVYCGISVLAYFMTTAFHFVLLACLVGTVQGGTQALSRSLFASMIPSSKSGEFFGFFSVFEKFAGILGPLFFAVMIQATGSSQGAILSVMAFFLIGGFLLAFVKVEEGQAQAREAERALASEA